MASLRTIEGMDANYAAALREAGIRSTDALLEEGATSLRRQELAVRRGVSEPLIMAWVTRSDLMRVRSVGPEYSGVLAAAGVAS